jgi:hypothetical protein
MTNDDKYLPPSMQNFLDSMAISTLDDIRKIVNDGKECVGRRLAAKWWIKALELEPVAEQPRD